MESTESDSAYSKLFKFDWKKDFWWILFIIALLFAAYGYRHDISQCQKAAMHPCEYCYYGGNATEFVDKYPTASLQCNWVGVPAGQLPLSNIYVSGVGNVTR